MKDKLPVIALALMQVMLIACESVTPVVHSACLDFHAIRPTPNDWRAMSKDLNDQITGHDAVWDRLCSADPVR